MKRKVSGIFLLLFVALLSFSSAAKAEEAVKPDDVKHYRIGFRALYVFPTESFDKRLDSSNLSLSKNFAPCADLEYFFTNNISTELIAGVTKHSIKSNGNEIGSTYVLPPSITLKYHPFGDVKWLFVVSRGLKE